MYRQYTLYNVLHDDVMHQPHLIFVTRFAITIQLPSTSIGRLLKLEPTCKSIYL